MNTWRIYIIIIIIIIRSSWKLSLGKCVPNIFESLLHWIKHKYELWWWKKRVKESCLRKVFYGYVSRDATVIRLIHKTKTLSIPLPSYIAIKRCSRQIGEEFHCLLSSWWDIIVKYAMFPDRWRAPAKRMWFIATKTIMFTRRFNIKHRLLCNFVRISYRTLTSGVITREKEGAM